LVSVGKDNAGKTYHMKKLIFRLAATFFAGISLAVSAQTEEVTTAQPDSIVAVTAEAYGLTQMAPADLPLVGTYWEVMPYGLMAPLPCPPWDLTQPIYAITDDIFLVDETGGQVGLTRNQAMTSQNVAAAVEAQGNALANLIDQIQETQFEQSMAIAFGMDVFTPGEGGDSGTNYFTPNGSEFALPDYGTNLWIAQTCITNGNLAGIGTNTISEVLYEIQSLTNLVQTNWQSEGFIYGSVQTNWTPLSIAQLGRANLFIRLRSWASSDGSSIPDWWEVQYGLSNVDPNAQDSAGDGYTIYQKYQLGINPGTWVTPAAPQGLMAALHQSNNTATITWLPSSGALTGYILEKTDAYTSTVQYFTNSATTTSYQDNLLTDIQDPYNGYNYDVTYQLKAIYTNGQSSPWTAPLPLQRPTVSASIIPGANGATYLGITGVPANATTVRLLFIDIDAVSFYDDASFNYTKDIPVSSFTNGVYPLPDSWQPTADGYGDDNDYVFAESVDADGNPSGATFFDGRAGTWPAPYNWNVPSYDGRMQMKQNLVFQLRAATVDNALHFQIPGAGGTLGAYVGEYIYPTNYAYAGLYQFANPTAGTFYFNESFDPFLPYKENYLFRNFAFSPANADNHGNLTTGVSASGGSSDYVTLATPSFQFQIYLTNSPALLTTDATHWLFYDQSSSGEDVSWAGLISFSGGTITMASGALNWFGLPYVSANIAAQSYFSGNLITNVVTAGDSSSSVSYSNGYNVYLETRQPLFRTVEYDFWNPSGIVGGNFIQNATLPGDPDFSVTNQSQLFIIPINSQIQIAGYAKLEVTNSAYTGVYGYLGQYFDKAYKMDAGGIVTTNTTGVLSPYGTFTATESGPIALVTMPDVDTGARGTGIVHCVSLQVDKNHDGVMDLSFSGADATSQASPMEFWVNNGNDQPNTTIGGGLDYDAQVPPAPPNYAPSQFYPIGHISCARDLENFARLWICGLPALGANYQVTLNWQNYTNSPAVNLYNSVESNGGTRYLTNTNVAASQCLGFNTSTSYGVVDFKGPGIAIASITPSSSFTFPANSFTNAGNRYFLFEGAGIGSGELTMTITDPNSNVVAQTGVWLDLHDIKNFYEGARITNSYSFIVSNWNSSIESVRQASANALGTDTNMIVWVHGINVPYWNWLDAGDTIFKRLYWAGYGGKFMAAGWPCLTGLQVIDFNQSELRACKASFGLTNYFAQLRTRFPGSRLNVLAHSQGNAIVSEAVREGANLDTYILTEGAMGTGCYDINYTNYALAASQESSIHTPQAQPMGYLGIYTNFTGRLVNFYNYYDPVLDIWLVNQLQLKPNELTFNGGNYAYIGTNSYHLLENGPTLLVTDPQESRAMVSRALTLPIGQSAPTTQHGVIQSGVDMHLSYGFYNAMPDDHSSQWTWPIQRALPYYQQVILTIQPIQ